MGKTIRKQFGIKFIEGNRKAHKKLKYICRCEYCMGLRKRKLQIKEKQKAQKENLVQHELEASKKRRELEAFISEKLKTKNLKSPIKPSERIAAISTNKSKEKNSER